MTTQNFPKVWYASAKRIGSIWKFLVFDDIGSLNICDSILEFKGRKNNIQINNIRSVSIVKQKINWGVYLIVNILAIFYIYLFFLKLILGALIVLLLANIEGLLIGSNTKWILVEYLDQSNKPKKAYFADGSMFGWSGIFGGTKEIYNILKSKFVKG